MGKRRRGPVANTIQAAIRDARAGDPLAVLFLQVCAPDIAETLRPTPIQPHRKRKAASFAQTGSK